VCNYFKEGCPVHKEFEVGIEPIDKIKVEVYGGGGFGTPGAADFNKDEYAQWLLARGYTQMPGTPAQKLKRQRAGWLSQSDIDMFDPPQEKPGMFRTWGEAARYLIYWFACGFLGYCFFWILWQGFKLLVEYY
jgi:hypothetical protein